MRNVIKSLAICLLALCFGLNASAQSAKAVSGTVIDNTGAPIPGAMILDKNNGKWATTLDDGSFTLEGAQSGDALEITCLGFATYNAIYNGAAKLDVTLQDDAETLDEAIAIGYGSVKKKDLTGSVGVLHKDVLEQQSVTSLSQSLQGTIPGLTVTRSSSVPGASASLLVRGVTTISDTSPLILVDGMIVSDIDRVNPDDVEQITVLKDAASASIYGARAAAGVILITTKTAKEGEVMIKYNGEVSAITATFADYLQEPVTYMTMFNEYKWNDAGNPAGGEYQQYAKDYIENYYANNAMDPIEYPNFDWKNAILKKAALHHKHNVTMAYGNKVVKTRVSAGYDYTDALYKGLDYAVTNVRMRNTFNISKHLTGDLDFSFRHAVKNSPKTTPIQAANMYPSIYLGLYPDGRIGPSKTGSNTLGVILDGGSNHNTHDYITGKISLSYKPFEGFDITGAFTPNYAFSKTKNFNKKLPYYDAYDTNLILGYVSGHNTNDLTESRSDTDSFEAQIIATYEKSFNNKHNLNVMVGYEDYEKHSESFSTSTTDMELSNFPYLDLANASNLTTSGDASANAYRSFFGRLMYNYKGKYYVQLNAREDASSRFHKKYRWGFVPSASIGWVVSEENWMQNLTPVSYLKLRASLGTLGNERIGNYPYQSLIGFSTANMYDTTGKLVSQTTGAQSSYVIPDISWETTWTWDAGLDATFFNNRLDLTFDYFYKETKDMLLALKIPSFIGYGDPDQNAGTMHTRGWEVKVGWHDKVGDFTYGVSANLSDAVSVMGNLNGTVFLGDQIVTEGEEYYAWYGYKSTGIYQTNEEVAAAPTQLIPTLAAGDIGYADLGGNIWIDENGVEHNEPDGMVNATYDKTILGSSLPHFIYGANFNVGWKGLSLGVLINGVGKQLSRVQEYMVRPMAGQWLAAPANLINADGTRNYWSVYNDAETNARAQFPRISYTSAEKNNFQMSDYWLFNGAYLRVKNINLAYTFPQKTLKGIGLKGLKFYLNADDPFLFSNYLKGWDPEQTTQSYIARTYTFGVDITF